MDTRPERKRLPRAPLMRAVQEEAPKEESIQRLLAAGKLADQTKHNYVMRVKAYMKRTGRMDDTQRVPGGE